MRYRLVSSRLRMSFEPHVISCFQSRFKHKTLVVVCVKNKTWKQSTSSNLHFIVLMGRNIWGPSYRFTLNKAFCFKYPADKFERYKALMKNFIVECYCYGLPRVNNMMLPCGLNIFSTRLLQWKTSLVLWTVQTVTLMCGRVTATLALRHDSLTTHMQIVKKKMYISGPDTWGKINCVTTDFTHPVALL